jgi:hypothetical protein
MNISSAEKQRQNAATIDRMINRGIQAALTADQNLADAVNEQPGAERDFRIAVANSQTALASAYARMITAVVAASGGNR